MGRRFPLIPCIALLIASGPLLEHYNNQLNYMYEICETCEEAPESSDIFHEGINNLDVFHKTGKTMVGTIKKVFLSKYQKDDPFTPPEIECTFSLPFPILQ
jgi:hypothetical protein